jgi:sulfur-oxidizing protein SoxY
MTRDTPTTGASAKSPRMCVISRRDLLLNARTAGLITIFTPAALLPRAIAEDTVPAAVVEPPIDPATGQPTAQETLRRLLRGAKPIDGKIKLELPEIAENGNVVPFTVTADSPMTDEAHIKSVHIVCSGNPQPLIGSFHFTPLSGQAMVTSRMRLAKTQDLFILVERNDGQFILAQRTVKVTIGGCGGT